MKNILPYSLILGFVTLSILLYQQPALSNIEFEKGEISVSSETTKELAPDVAEITFRVKTSHPTSLQTATSENKKIINNVIAALNSYINKQKGDFIKTSSYNANPVYSYKDSKKKLEGYEVSNNITIHTTNLEKIGEMIDKSDGLGVTNVDSLNFTVQNYNSQCGELLTQTTIDAKNKADTIAKALSQKLAGVKTLNSSCGINTYSPRFYLAKNMLSATADAVSEGASTQITSGTIKLKANINATFYVK